MKKTRLDIYLHEQGYTHSREIAKKLIMAGQVQVNEKTINKGSFTVCDDDTILIKKQMPYVSRGGYKLEKALAVFDFDPTGRVMLDVGASTGGFTDCLLQNGATKIYAVDVGYGQLSWKLRNDERVVVAERTNARYITPQSLGEICDGVVCDASFISLTKLLPAMDICTKEDADFIGLIKPQFEAGRDQVGKGGIIRDKVIHIQVVQNIVDFLTNSTSFTPIALDYSPITGPKGNMEFLLHCKKGDHLSDIDIISTVEKAHLSLKSKK